MFKDIVNYFKKDMLWKKLKERQNTLIEDKYGGYYHYDTLVLSEGLYGSGLKKFYKEWFKQKAKNDCGTVMMPINKRGRPALTNGRFKDKVLLTLIKEGYLVMTRDGGRNKKHGITGLKQSRCHHSYLHWTGKL